MLFAHMGDLGKNLQPTDFNLEELVSVLHVQNSKNTLIRKKTTKRNNLCISFTTVSTDSLRLSLLVCSFFKIHLLIIIFIALHLPITGQQVSTYFISISFYM